MLKEAAVRRLFLLSLICLTVLMGFAITLQAAAPQLPSGPGGQRVSDYLKAFNSGDEAIMRGYYEANVAPEALKRRSVEERLQVYRQMRDNLKTLTFHSVLAASDSTIEALLQAGNGEWLDCSFMLDPVVDQKLLGIRIEQTDPPSEQPQASTVLTQAEAADEAAKLLDSLVKQDLFSGTVLIAKEGAPFFRKAYGTANKGTGTPNNLDTKFNIGSINKTFTQVAICQLADQGKVSFDDLLGKWLPDYPNADARNKVTIRHLLTMSSGIGDFFGERFEATPKDRIRTINDFMKLFADLPLSFEPGTQEQYSNGGYVVLGAIIEKVTGQTYYDYIREHVYKPAGMTSSESYEADVPPANLAEGYTSEATGASSTLDGRVWNLYTRPARGSSAGGGYSTAGDLLKFAEALRNMTLLSADASEWMLGNRFDGKRTPEKSKATQLTSGGFGFAGGAPGLNAVIETDFGTGYSIAVMSNYDPPSAQEVARKLRQLVKRIR